MRRRYDTVSFQSSSGVYLLTGDLADTSSRSSVGSYHGRRRRRIFFMPHPSKRHDCTVRTLYDGYSLDIVRCSGRIQNKKRR